MQFIVYCYYTYGSNNGCPYPLISFLVQTVLELCLLEEDVYYFTHHQILASP
jgi:hypothetical protein